MAFWIHLDYSTLFGGRAIPEVQRKGQTGKGTHSKLVYAGEGAPWGWARPSCCAPLVLFLRWRFGFCMRVVHFPSLSSGAKQGRPFTRSYVQFWRSPSACGEFRRAVSLGWDSQAPLVVRYVPKSDSNGFLSGFVMLLPPTQAKHPDRPVPVEVTSNSASQCCTLRGVWLSGAGAGGSANKIEWAWASP